MLLLKLEQEKAEKIILKVHGTLCLCEVLQHSILSLRRMLVWVREQKEREMINSKQVYADSMGTTTVFWRQSGSNKKEMLGV